MNDRPETPVQMRLERLPEDERASAAGAMLYMSSEPVPVAVLGQHLGCTEAETRTALTVLAERLPGVGLLLQWVDAERVQLTTAPHLARLVQRFLGLERTVRLSQAALETLAVVAYHQPVTRAEVDAIRGVDSSGVLQTLIARDLIEPVGRLPTVGNPIQYRTTPEFLRFFGLTSLADLPKLEAEPEAGDGPAESELR